MKLMVLSDLHLGKKVNEFSLMDDQIFIVQQMFSLLDEHQPDGLIIAGDVYDKSQPAAEAVRLLDQLIAGVAERAIRLFMISGNHDSADRLAFGASIFSAKQIHIAPAFRQPLSPITWQVGEVTADIYLLPFIKPAHVRAVWPEAEINGYDGAISHVLSQLELRPERFNLLVAHQFIQGAEVFDSDDILVGGIDQVSAVHFKDFHLVTLGHLHGPQRISENIIYPGSPLKYSFSETKHTKTVPLIQIEPDLTYTIEYLPISPLRDMRQIRGPFASVTQPEVYEKGNQGDYLQITLTDELEIPDAIAKLRAIYPNLMKLSYDNRRTQTERAFQASREVHHKSPMELFQDFFSDQNNQDLSSAQLEYLQQLFEEIEVN